MEQRGRAGVGGDAGGEVVVADRMDCGSADEGAYALLLVVGLDSSGRLDGSVGCSRILERREQCSTAWGPTAARARPAAIRTAGRHRSTRRAPAPMRGQAPPRRAVPGRPLGRRRRGRRRAFRRTPPRFPGARVRAARYPLGARCCRSPQAARAASSWLDRHRRARSLAPPRPRRPTAGVIDHPEQGLTLRRLRGIDPADRGEANDRTASLSPAATSGGRAAFGTSAANWNARRRTRTSGDRIDAASARVASASSEISIGVCGAEGPPNTCGRPARNASTSASEYERRIPGRPRSSPPR